MNRIIAIVIIFIGFGLKNYGQKDSVKVYIYEPFKSDQSIEQKNIKVDKNCLKWNFSLLARGVFAINYERSISEKFSFELGCGPTYRDYLFEAGRGNDDFIEGDDNDEVRIGIFAEGNLRFYPTQGNLEGFYISPGFRYRNYNITSKIEQNSDYSYFDAGYNMMDLSFVIGIQNTSWFSDVVYDYYFGVSLRNRVLNEFDTDNVPVGVITWKPSILFGIKIGLSF